MSVLLTPPGPDLRLLASLASWTWIGSGPDGHELAHILITESLASIGPDAEADTAEVRVRRFADSLGGLGGVGDVVQDAGRCLRIVGGQVSLHFPGSSRRLRLPARPEWMSLVTGTVEAVLLLGLDPLPQASDAVQLDAYLDTTLAADRLLFGRARIR
ncbi:hypothetical protein OG785_17345 [Streptomyces sp. NBC_00006]|uniref:hypothetical protein n=1 Tax=unclassified Streptomyces TaxID=2593676 RepID=UPI0022524552|nr:MULTISPECIES: hypothetical protein [unclassified Streptomyces]MCX4828320.1 hypothetical protein [Streptomyces sp. NBC_01016]MCX5532328.1 hypothetical protein [Streptomyces sp. NBC_00006]